ncbi:MAG: crossover junction endodeoxyribonuclease RuvC [Candidatus Buchananbacteria bacterium CG10_big_fil_rev_8_21_14_0_10_42_9]|uniref:Crossover junction endodeoxyribonuclease RuvC n=1 Tax=Candidatus Buchananbacteria bacterium CG10_big_fil_rev_8_21_14_0_10_42_9 TaxID=1974526 RepID=A0A2H0W0E4_9BACT|nr:MAG: crossover junction endodeoxyribonuclease RuvC [Candidatus Buchananbacteria bacterium CG10_big_fil_rev_8_21_14_0_10_42_9]
MPTGTKIILGVDPGLANTGYGVISVTGNKLNHLEHGVIITKNSDSLAKRLYQIASGVEKIIITHKPKLLAIEEIFFAKNAKTAMLVGQAKGAILLTAERHQLKTVELTPLQIKMALIGYGKADKNQIQQMIKTLLKLKQVPSPDHAADALACAVCGIHKTKTYDSKN